MARRAALLIGELLQLAARVLPATNNAHVQSLPHLFSLASSFDLLMPRLSASAALSSVDSINRNRARLLTNVQQPSQKRMRSDSLEDQGNSSATIRLQVERSKMRAGYQIDDVSFRNLLVESNVLQNMNNASSMLSFSTWNVEVIIDLLEGALLNSRRLEEVIKGTKFLRRLMTFFHPLERKYADLPRTPASPVIATKVQWLTRVQQMNARYTKLAVTLITTLLSSQEGIRFLAEDKFLKQIVDALSMLDPLASATAFVGDIIFSKKRIQDTMSGTYLELLALFTKFEDGYK